MVVRIKLSIFAMSLRDKALSLTINCCYAAESALVKRYSNMTTSMIRRNLIQKFVMTEFVSNRINTQKDVDRMLNMITTKLNMNNDEAKSFLRESIGLAK